MLYEAYGKESEIVQAAISLFEDRESRLKFRFSETLKEGIGSFLLFLISYSYYRHDCLSLLLYVDSGEKGWVFSLLISGDNLTEILMIEYFY